MIIKKTSCLLAVVLWMSCASADAAQNTTINSFSKAKKTLLTKVYYDHHKTIYCGAEFHADKKVLTPVGFSTTKYVKRAKRIEWEHIVPAENFGRTFVEWRTGDPKCVNSKGKRFKGRSCASKVNMSYRYMQSDMYNLAPAIGAVNAMRSNYNFTMLPSGTSSFGSCDMIISSKKAQPPEDSRGEIARAYKYMEWAYPRYSMSEKQRKLMNAWDKMYPVSNWECTRAKRTEKIQGNRNPFVSDYCQQEMASFQQSTLYHK